MKRVAVIQCTFQPRQWSNVESGIAICDDVDTPYLFIKENGRPYLGKTVWRYELHHHAPWIMMDLGNE